MYSAIRSSAFDRDVKKCIKKHRDMGALKAAISAILYSDEEPIPLKYNDHALGGDKQGKRELHIGGRNSDWLILYDIVDDIVGLAEQEATTTCCAKRKTSNITQVELAKAMGVSQNRVSRMENEDGVERHAEAGNTSALNQK